MQQARPCRSSLLHPILELLLLHGNCAQKIQHSATGKSTALFEFQSSMHAGRAPQPSLHLRTQHTYIHTLALSTLARPSTHP